MGSKIAKRKTSDWAGWTPALLLVGLFLGAFFLMGREAYRGIKTSSPEWKTRFLSDFPGLEQAPSLPSAKRNWVVQKANEEQCSCACGYTLATCLTDDLNCPLRSKNLARIWELISQ